MASPVICDTTCGTNKPQAQYFNCVDVTRAAGSKEFILMSCTWVPSDITDAAEWTSAQTSDDVHKSPPGILTFQAPSADLITIDGCNRKIPGEITQLVDYVTYQTKDDLSDCDYWKDLFDNAASYRIAFVDCNNIFKLTSDWAEAVKTGANTVPGRTPGFEFSVTVVPHEIEGEGRLVTWVTQFEIILDGVVCGVDLPGVYSVLS